MKKLIALLLALVMVLALAACAAKTEPAKTETTDTKTEQTTTEETKTEDPAPAEETTGEKMYIPVMAKGFQHQFWQAVAKGSEDAAKDLGVEIYFDGPASETEIDAQVNMVKTELAKNPRLWRWPLCPLTLSPKFSKSAQRRTSPSSALTPAFPAIPPALSRRPPAPTTKTLLPSLLTSSTRMRLSSRL